MCVHKSFRTSNSLLDSLGLEDLEDNCDYHDLNKTVDNQQSDLAAIHLNIRGVNSKIGELMHLIDNSLKCQSPEIIMLCETWLKSNSPRPLIPGYTLERHDRKRKQGGGTGILISSRCKYRRRHDLEVMDCTALESCFIELDTRKKSIIFGSIYRPPNSSPNEFLELFHALSKKLQTENSQSDFVLGLDHNLDLLKHGNHKPTRLFVEQLYDVGLVPLITKPTRISHSSATLIDNILVNYKLSDNSDQGIICDNISDHLPCYALLHDIYPTKKEETYITTRDLRAANLNALKHKLNEGVLLPNPTHGVDEQFNYFHETLVHYTDCFIPIVSRKINPKDVRREKWICSGLLRSIKKCKCLYRKHITDKTNAKLFDRYKHYNQTLQKTKRFAKKSYYLDQCRQHQSNSKKLWQTINHVIRKTNNKSEVIEKLKIDNITEQRGEVIAEELATYFSTVGKVFANEIVPSVKSERDYLNSIPLSSRSIFLAPVTTIEIDRIITKMVPKTSSGIDEINNKLLKEIKPILLVPLEQIFNLSLERGVFPKKMKTAKVVPLHKGKSKEYANNYRPISLLLTVSKVLEKVVYSRVYEFLSNTGQLYVSQYGFRKKHACEHAVGELVSAIVKGFEEGKHTAGVFLDLSKAFDTLNHASLLLKLERYGLRGPCLRWFESYLTNRQMLVSCRTNDSSDVSTSRTHKVEFGAPQGSCLGPLLFLIYCNDLQLHLLYLNCIQFADDTTLYVTHMNLNYINFVLNHDLEILQDWFRANKLTLNVGKSVCILFNKNADLDRGLQIKINDEPIPQVEFTRFLGMWIDQSLNWREHASRLVLKLTRNTHLLRMGKHILSPHAQKILYHAQISSNILYGLSIWGSMASQCDLNKIQTIQSRCVSLINCHKTTIQNYKDAKILKINTQTELEMCKLWHKHYLGELPLKLSNEMAHNHKKEVLMKTHKYDTRNKHLHNVVLAKSKHYSSSFLVKGNVEYSKHKDCLTLTTVSNYSKQLKQKLLNQEK